MAGNDISIIEAYTAITSNVLSSSMYTVDLCRPDSRGIRITVVKVRPEKALS